MSLTPTSARDVVAVLDSELAQVFQQARAIKATVGRASKSMEHPLETGSTITDHRIILPVTVELSLILSTKDYPSVYQQVRDIFTRGDLLTVQTRVDSFPDMLIEKMPHEESVDIFDGVTVALSLKQAQFVQPQFSFIKVAQPKATNTAKRGQQQPEETPPAKKKSVLSGFFK